MIQRLLVTIIVLSLVHGDAYRAVAQANIDASLSVQKIDRIQSLISHHQSDQPKLDDIAHKLDGSVENIHRWIRVNSQLGSYQGVLRGPNGVLADGIANPLDRAILLDTILVAAGHQTRLASLSLDDGQRARLLRKLRPLDGAFSVTHPRAELVLDRVVRQSSNQSEELLEMLDGSLSVASRPAIETYWWVEVFMDGQWIPVGFVA